MKKLSKKLLSVLLIVAMLIPTGAFMVNTNAATVSIPDDAVEFNGHYYKAYSTTNNNMQWVEAKQFCENIGGHLATITSVNENNFVMSLLTDVDYYLGATDEKIEGEWEWITGEIWDYTNWDKLGHIEPNNRNNQDWLAIQGPKASSSENLFGAWDDLSINTTYSSGFICEWESNEHTITGKINGSSNTPKIAIDGTWYEYDTSVPGLADAIEKFAIGNTITCKIRFGKIVACSKKEIKNNVTFAINTTKNIEYDSKTNTYSPESIALDLIITNNVKNSNGGVVDTTYLAGYDFTFDKLEFDVENGDMLYFKDGFLDWGSTQKLEKEFKTPVTLKAGQTFSFSEDLVAYVKNDYNWNDSDRTKNVQIVARAYNGATEVASQFIFVSFNNKNADLLATNKADLDKKIQNAANLLKNTSGVMTDAYLEKLLTKEGLQEATNALKCKVALSSAVLKVNKNSTFEEKLIEKLMKKAGISKDWMGAAYTTDITYSMPAATKENGKFEVEFNIELTNINIGNNNPYAGFSFSTTYEIKGGKNIEKRSGSIPSWFGYANIETFANSVTEVALEQVEYAYNLGYGDNFNKVCDMFFGDTITAILEKTPAGSYSHIAYESMTYPSKKMNVHCPVDIYVYDSEGTLCASVESNEITLTCDDIVIEVVGDEKYLTIYDGEYSVEIIATATDDMDIEIEEYSSTDKLFRTAKFNNIALTPGDSFKTDIDEDYFYKDYSITKNEEEIISADSDESSVHYIDAVEVTDKNATCTEDGEYHIECANCNETILTGKIPATGHADTDHNGICDSCSEDFTKGCKCNCHSNAFMQFLHKILCFFRRLFGMNQYQYCDCGKAHW